MHPFPPPRPSLLGLLLAAAVAAGCSPQSKVSRFVESANGHLAAGRYDAAEIEFINALRIDSRSAAAMAGLGAIYFDQGSLLKAAPRLAATRELAPEDLDSRVRLARTLLTVGRPGEARTEALFVLSRRSGDADALAVLAESSQTPEQIAETRSRLTAEDAATHVALAVLDLRERKTPEATAHVERALALDAKSAAAHSLDANLRLARGDRSGALAAFRTAADLSPIRSPRRLALARHVLGSGDIAGGRKILEEAVRQAPDFVAASVMLADVEASVGNYDAAQAILTAVLTRDPDNPEASVIRVRIHLARGETATAIEVMEKLTARFPESAPMHHLLATAYLASGDTNRASASVARTLQLAPEHAEAQLMRAAIQLRTGDAATAIAGLRELVKKHPNLGRARTVLAEALRSRGQVDEALQVYVDSIATAPQDPQLRLLAGHLLVRLGRTEEARQYFEQALAIRSDFIPAVEQLVALDLAAKDLEAAARRARSHAAAHDSQAEAHMLVAKVAVAERAPDRAEAALRRAIEVSPDLPAPYLLLGQIYIEGRRIEEALAQLYTAAEKNPRDISALMLIGILKQQQGEHTAARDAYEKILATNPRFVPALNNLAYLYSENLGQLDRAFELADRARALRPSDPVALDTFGWILFKRRDYTWALSVLTESASRLTTHPEVQFHLGMTHYMLADETGARTALGFAAAAAEPFPGQDQARTHLAILDVDPAHADAATAARLRAHLEQTPGDPIALIRLAAIHAERGEHAEALSHFEAALKATPQSATVVTSFARYLATRPAGLARAFELAKNAYTLAPENPAVLHVIGSTAYATGDHTWAASLLRECVRRNPGDAQAQFDFARAAYAIGQVDDAIAALRIVIEIERESPRAAMAREFAALAETARMAPLPESAAGLATNALKARPDDVAALMLAAIVAEKSGDTGSAVAGYEKVLARHPRFSPARKRLALLLAAENPPTARAFESASAAREMLPNDPEVAAALGTIHLRRGEFARAVTLLGEAARSPAATPETHYLLGVGLRQSGDAERSRASLQRALDLGLGGEHAVEARRLLGQSP